jgi:aminopeptidase-like protein
MNMISYCDGQRTLLEIAEIIGEPADKLAKLLDLLVANGLVETTHY